MTDKVVLFYGHKDPFSNMYRCSIEFNGLKFSSVEQGYMLCKAGFFNDKEIMSRLMTETDPYECKKLGRMIAGFDPIKWDQQKIGVMAILCFSKFKQNKDLMEILVQTGNRQLGEASPSDMEWGIGLSLENPLAKEQRNWKGKNLLGRLLMDVRNSELNKDLYFPEIDQSILKDAGII